MNKLLYPFGVFFLLAVIAFIAHKPQETCDQANCLVADTLIMTEHGCIQISQLDNQKHAIMFLNSKMEIAYTKNYKVRQTGKVELLYLFRLENGHSILGTGDHKIAFNNSNKKDGFGFNPLRNTNAFDLDCVTLAWDRTDPKLAYDKVKECKKQLLTEGQMIWALKNEDDCYKKEGNFFANGILVHD